MFYVILTVIVIVCIGIYRLFIRPIWMTSRMKKGVLMVKMALAYRTIKSLLPKYDKEMAFKLAAAITNEIFSEVPTTEEARQFLKENRLFIRSLAHAISEDIELCHLLSSAMIYKGILDWSHGKGS